MLLFVLGTCLLLACGQSYEEQKRVARIQRRQLMREDSAALKVAVLPTIDCLPLYLAKEHHMFDTLGADVRLRRFTAQMDCDTAFERGRVEVMVSDLVRTERLKTLGMKIDYLSATDAYWQLYANRTARIRELKQLDDRMVAMTRYSVTDMLAEMAVDSAKLKPERVFRIQVNDVFVRLQMLQNNEMDALLLTEPQASEARSGKHQLLLDTRRLDMSMGVVAANAKTTADKSRQRQLEVLKQGYNTACDSLNERGLAAYADLLLKYYGLSSKQIDKLSKDIKFRHMAAPRDKDVERARKWVEKL